MILVVGIGGWGTTRVSASHQTLVGSFLSQLPPDATLLMQFTWNTQSAAFYQVAWRNRHHRRY